MAELHFVDTNVLLYRFDNRNSAKQAAAERWMDLLWRERAGRLSWQVLQEFYTNITRKFHLAPKAGQDHVRIYSVWVGTGIDLNLVERAWEFSHQYQVSHWDALILAAAERSQCRYLLSEDFEDRREYGAIQVISPFRSDPPGGR